jgi:hypothetical protein
MADAPEEDGNQVADAIAIAVGDLSFWLLVAANGAAIFIGWNLNLELAGLVFVYWMHSFVIGVTHVIRIRALLSGDKPLPGSAEAKRSLSGFTMVSGWFHLFYLAFILGLTHGHVGRVGVILLCAAAFIFEQVAVLLRRLKEDAAEPPDLPLVSALPYLRILPVSIIMLVAFAALQNPSRVALLAFGVIKTLMDAVMHITEQYVIAKNAGDI